MSVGQFVPAGGGGGESCSKTKSRLLQRRPWTDGRRNNRLDSKTGQEERFFFGVWPRY